MRAIAMQNSLLRVICLCALLGLFLAACQGPEALTETPQAATAAPFTTRLASPVAAVAQAAASATVPSKELDRPKASFKPAATATPVAARQTVSPARRICSPLAEHGPEELAAIVSDPYHPPPLGKDDRHQGVDFSYYRQAGRATIEGEGVQSVLGGRVAAAIPDSFPFGNLVIVETSKDDLPDGLPQALDLAEGQSLYVLYAHLEAPPLVQPGDAVQACQALGVVGKSGNAGVAHLHLETRKGPAGSVFGEMAYYTLQASQIARDNYYLWRMSGAFQHFDPMILLGNALMKLPHDSP
jgi:murein DD-endopeptidase MepM/ murein hydrolase activator NlpD